MIKLLNVKSASDVLALRSVLGNTSVSKVVSCYVTEKVRTFEREFVKYVSQEKAKVKEMEGVLNRMEKAVREYVESLK